MSDSHELCSLLLVPNRASPLIDITPMLDPCRVTLIAPLDPVLARRTTLPVAHDVEIPRVKLPVRRPTDTEARLLPITPPCVWHRTDVSASQVVRSHDVSPADPATVGPPNPAPSIVTLTDPVAAALALSTWLT